MSNERAGLGSLGENTVSGLIANFEGEIGKVGGGSEGQTNVQRKSRIWGPGSGVQVLGLEFLLRSTFCIMRSTFPHILLDAPTQPPDPLFNG